MSIIEAIILGIIQGLTEFIPVSSSGHLIIGEKWLGIKGGSLTFDVFLHGGTLLALIVFFNKDIVLLIKSLFIKNYYTKVAWLIAMATLPAVLAGLLLENSIENHFRLILLVAINLIVVALIMLLAEHLYENIKVRNDLKKITRRQAIIIGLAQSAAIIPGVSRSGSTITAGLFAGLDRISATRFSFLLGIPIIFGAIIKTIFFGDGLSHIQSDVVVFITGATAAFISGLFAIKFLLGYLAKHTLKVFAFYRIALGVIIIILAIV